MLAIEPPTVSINPPSKEDFETPFRNSTILCRVEGLRTTDVTLKWLKNGVLVKSGFTTVGPISKTLNSKLTVTEGEWNADNVFTCKVDGKNISEMRNTSKSFECGCKLNSTTVSCPCKIATTCLCSKLMPHRANLQHMA